MNETGGFVSLGVADVRSGSVARAALSTAHR